MKKTDKIKVVKKEQSISKNYIRVIFGMLLVIACLVTYSKITSYSLLYIDDNDIVSEYSKMVSEHKSVSDCFTKLFGDNYYRPVLSMSFYLSAIISGEEPKGYYITNIAIHIIAVLMIFILFIKLKIPDIFSFLACLLLAVHPILTPAVAWISGRNDPLLLIFSAMSFIFLLDYINSESEPKKKIYLLLNFLTFLAALYTKESAIVLPVLFALYIYLFKKEQFKIKNIVLPLILWIVGIILFFVARQAVNITFSDKDLFGIQAILINIPSFFAITGKIFIPWNMNGSAHFDNFSIVSGILVISVLSVIVFIKRKELNLRLILFFTLFYVLFIIPTLLIRIENPHFDYLEHRSYPIIFAAILIIYEILRVYKIDFRKSSFLITASIIIILFFIKTSIYSNTFSDRINFQEAVINMYPESYTGYYNLGKAYDAENNLEQALINHKTAIDKNPNIKNVYIYLSSLYQKKNLLDEAEKMLIKAEKLDSTDIFVRWNFGLVYIQKGDTAKALTFLESALTPKNKNPQWISEAAVNFLAFGNYPKATYYFNKAIELNSKELSNYINLGVSYFYNHQTEKSEETWLKAVTHFPTAYEPHANLVEFYVKVNNIEKAKFHAKEAVRLGGGISQENSWLLH